MKKITLLGAGRSSYSLIQYLIKLVAEKKWQLTIGDTSLEAIHQKVGSQQGVRAIVFDVHNKEQRETEIKLADVVISLLPPPFHFPIAQACVQHGKHLLTASYVSEDIQSLEEQAKAKGVLILKEMGLDPGIDHMSALMEIDRIRREGGQLLSFKSYTGGLVSPESDNNPWHYKVTWNPRNVVLAGQGTVKYLEDGAYKFIPYHKLFKRVETIEVAGYGKFEGYANRDSLKYISTYQLDAIPSFIRGTLRRPGYCQSWDLLVQLGLTEDTYEIEHLEDMSWREFTEAYLPKGKGTLEERVAAYLNVNPGGDEIKNLEWLGLFSEEKIAVVKATPAQVVQKLIETRWRLGEADKDMIVMQHQMIYELNGRRKQLVSSLVVKGDTAMDTAMAKTVGLPLGIAARLILEGKINLAGVHIPVVKPIYEPVIQELAVYGIRFINELSELDL